MGGVNGKAHTANETESEASDVLSNEEDLTSALQCGVAEYKTWTNVEGEDIRRIETLVSELREYPLLPPLPAMQANLGRT